VAAHYEGVAKELLHKLKFERARAGALPAAVALDSVLPQLPADILVCHIPTANNRIRRRGYDQAEEIVKELCRLRGWRRKKVFLRSGSARQVGATRKERFAHLEKALRLDRDIELSGLRVLLVDDVTTTGATIETAAKILKRAGAKSVDAAIFAQA
jgi:ComF family protein